MAEFTIDGQTFETENLDQTQKRVIGLYQKCLQEESDAAANLSYFNIFKYFIWV